MFITKTVVPGPTTFNAVGSHQVTPYSLKKTTIIPELRAGIYEHNDVKVKATKERSTICISYKTLSHVGFY